MRGTASSNMCGVPPSPDSFLEEDFGLNDTG